MNVLYYAIIFQMVENIFSSKVNIHVKESRNFIYERIQYTDIFTLCKQSLGYNVFKKLGDFHLIYE